MITKLLLLTFLISPVLIIILTEKSKLAGKIGSILIAYGLGILLGNLGLFPHQSIFLQDYISIHPDVSMTDVKYLLQKGLLSQEDILAFRIYKLQDLLMTISIPIGIPLLLFSMNIRSWFRMAGKTAVSMVLALISVIIVISLLAYFYKPYIPNMNKIAGMLIGMYTGGTPNVASLKRMLNVDVDTYIKVHTYDMVPSLVYLLFLISIGRIFFRNILPAYPANNSEQDSTASDAYYENAYKGILKPKYALPLLFALLVSILIFGVAGGLSFLFPKNRQMLAVILIITTLGIAASMFRKINRIKKTFEFGMYFILLFSVVVASLADVQRLMNLSVTLFTAISIAIFGTLFLHTVLCRIFKVDADTLMITSTALICSPPFVPMIAGALKNREIIISGLTVGIIGYALGNYLGVIVSLVFQ